MMKKKKTTTNKTRKKRSYFNSIRFLSTLVSCVFLIVGIAIASNGYSIPVKNKVKI